MSRKIIGVTVGTAISPEAMKKKMDLDSGSNIFIATYGKTTNAEIFEAFDAGKACFVKQGGAFFPSSSFITSGMAFFSGVHRNALVEIVCHLDEWSRINRPEVTEITSESTHEQRPTAKAVYDLVSEHSGGSVGDEVFCVTIEGNDSDGYTTDTTASEIHSAFKAGKAVHCRLENLDVAISLPLTASGDGIEVFSGSTTTGQMEIKIVGSKVAEVIAKTVLTEDSLPEFEAWAENLIDEKLEGFTPDTGGNAAQGGGMSATASALLIGILRNAMYTADQSANITALEAALASGSSGDSGDSGGGDTTETTYTIVNVLTNVTNSNSASKATEGASYIGKLTAADGFNMSTVTVTMGGVDVTADVYADGTITIESVTGNVIITARAVEDSTTAPAFELATPLVLGDTTDPRINDTANCRIATGETVNEDEDWTMCIAFTSIAGTTCNNQSIVINENNQVSIAHNPANWMAKAHGVSCGIIQNEWDGGKFKGLSWIAVFTHNASTKTFNLYGTGTSTKTFETINTPAVGQLYVGHTDAIGTINRFALYKRVLSVDEITEWIGG